MDISRRQAFSTFVSFMCSHDIKILSTHMDSASSLMWLESPWFLNWCAEVSHKKYKLVDTVWYLLNHHVNFSHSDKFPWIQNCGSISPILVHKCTGQMSNSCPFSASLSKGTCPRDHCGPSLSHPLLWTFGISYPVIFHPFSLFLLLRRDSNIMFQVLSPAFPILPLASRLVMSPHPLM